MTNERWVNRNELLVGDTVRITAYGNDRQAFVTGLGFDSVTVYDPIANETSSIRYGYDDGRAGHMAALRYCHEADASTIPAGCYVDSHHGIHMIESIVDEAEAMGYRLGREDRDAVERNASGEYEDDDSDILVELEDHIEEWLNARVPVAHHFWGRMPDSSDWGLWLRGFDDEYGSELQNAIDEAEHAVETARRDRLDWIQLARANGATLDDIGIELGVTKQRVAQLLVPDN